MPISDRPPCLILATPITSSRQLSRLSSPTFSSAPLAARLRMRLRVPGTLVGADNCAYSAGQRWRVCCEQPSVDAQPMGIGQRGPRALATGRRA